MVLTEIALFKTVGLLFNFLVAFEANQGVTLNYPKILKVWFTDITGSEISVTPNFFNFFKANILILI